MDLNLTFISSTTFKNHSEQPSEEDERDPTSRLDSTCVILVQNFALTDSYQSETNQLKTAFANRFSLWIKLKFFSVS